MQRFDQIVRSLRAQHAILPCAEHKRRTGDPLDLVRSVKGQNRVCGNQKIRKIPLGRAFARSDDRILVLLFSDAETETLMNADNPGKPHIANLMVSKGYAKDRNEAIRTYLNQAHFAEEYVRPEDAIRAISESGGIPVLAHPPFGNGNQLILGNDLRARVRKLMGFGLSGLEGFYSGYSEKLRIEVLALAEAFDLYVTAGSDYHGSNKLVGLGDTGMDGTTEIPNGMTAFLQAIK